MKMFCISHSSRIIFEDRCKINAFATRFKPVTLDDLPPFDSLKDVYSANPYKGSISLWELTGNDKEPDLKPLAHIHPAQKSQSAAIIDRRIIIHEIDRLEVFDINLSLQKTITNPWIAGGHTIYPDGNTVWISLATANAILQIDIDSGEVLTRIRMPEIYGKGYPIEHDTDLKKHNIQTNYQPTHVNSVIPYQDGLIISCLRQGAIGFIRKDQSYREIAHGFSGCHSAKIDPFTHELFFADSPTGIVWFLDFNSGRILRRIHVKSRWLHDIECINETYLLAIDGEHNQLHIINKFDGTVLRSYECNAFGNGLVFANLYEVDDAWQELYYSSKKTLPLSKNDDHFNLSENLLEPLGTTAFWKKYENCQAGEIYTTITETQYDYLLSSKSILVTPGDYALVCKAETYETYIAVGVQTNDGKKMDLPSNIRLNHKAIFFKIQH